MQHEELDLNYNSGALLSPEDLRGDGFWYLSSPYSLWPGGIDDASWTIARLAGRLLARGVTVFSPIVHSHNIARAANIDPWSHEFWMPHDKPIAHCAGGMIVAGIPGWRESKGVGIELDWFKAAGKPRYLLDPSTLLSQAFD